MAAAVALLLKTEPYDFGQHDSTFESQGHAIAKLVQEIRRVRPTLFQPFWDKAGFALGAITAASAVAWIALNGAGANVRPAHGQTGTCGATTARGTPCKSAAGKCRYHHDKRD